MTHSRRQFLQWTGASAGAWLAAACGGGGGRAPTPAPVPPPVPTASPEMQALQRYLKAQAQPAFALPPLSTESVSIGWAGPLDPSTPISSLPNGIIYPLSSPSLAVTLRSAYMGGIPGDTQVGGIPCEVVSRPYVCKGQSLQAHSPTIIRLRTDAQVIELVGIVVDGNHMAQTLIVDGKIVPTKMLSSWRGVGGWNFAAVRTQFTSRAMRDVWIETGMALAYVKVDQGDTVTVLDDSADPQITCVGDSYLQQTSGYFGNGAAIALELGARLGIRKIAVDSIGGTGYYNSGNNLGNLNDRLSGHAADNSQIYVVMAGINDYADIVNTAPYTLHWPTGAEYEQAVANYLQGLRTAQPKALIVVTAPFCPIPAQSDSSYVANTTTNASGQGDNLYKAQVHRNAVEKLSGPWVYIDVLMGGGWVNSAGATGDITHLQWFTGGTAGPGTTATNKPGNTQGGGGGGGGVLVSIPIVTPGQYRQAPEILVTGGSGSGALVCSRMDSVTGHLTRIEIVQGGAGYTDGAGLPSIAIDPAFEIVPATLGTPTLGAGINPDGQYPLLSFAPAGVPASELNNIFELLRDDLTHPSAAGVAYLAKRLASNIHDAVMAL